MPIILPTPDSNISYFVAGAKLDGEKLLSAGGRVLGVTAVNDDLKSAVNDAYNAVKKVDFSNGFYRNDIGAKALKAL